MNSAISAGSHFDFGWRHVGMALQIQRDQRRGKRAEDLRNPVGRHIRRRATPAQPHGQRHRRVVMAAGNVAARIDHDHQRRADGQRRQEIVRRAVDDRHADGKDEKERANEFNEIFFHKSGIANFRPVNPGPRPFASKKSAPVALASRRRVGLEFTLGRAFGNKRKLELHPVPGRQRFQDCPPVQQK